MARDLPDYSICAEPYSTTLLSPVQLFVLKMSRKRLGLLTEELASVNRFFAEDLMKQFLSDKFHPKDFYRFKNDDRWIMDFIENNEYNMKNAVKQCCETLEWRNSFGVNGKEN